MLRMLCSKFLGSTETNSLLCKSFIILKQPDFCKLYQKASYSLLACCPKLYSKQPKPVICLQARSLWDNFPIRKRGVYHLKDKLDPNENELIYRSTIFNYVFYAQLVSMSVLAIQMFYGVVLAYSILYDIPYRFVESVGPFKLTFDALSLSIMCFFTIQNAFLFVVSQRTVLRIYYNEVTKDYVLVFLHWNPFTIRHVHCKLGELKELSQSHFGFLLGNFKLHGNRINLRPNYFTTLEHYNRMCGYLS